MTAQARKLNKTHIIVKPINSLFRSESKIPNYLLLLININHMYLHTYTYIPIYTYYTVLFLKNDVYELCNIILCIGREIPT